MTVASRAPAGDNAASTIQGLGMKTIGIAFTFLLLVVTGTALADAADEFRALLDEHWEWRLQSDPIMASTIGDRRFNREWPDRSVDATERRHREAREFLRRAYAIDRDALTDEDRLNHELFRRLLQNRVDAFQFSGHLLPFSQRGGVQNLDVTTDRLRLETMEDYDDWLARLGKIDIVIEQTIERAETGRKSGLMAPRVIMERLPHQIGMQLVEFAADSPFFEPFANFPETIPAAERERLRAEATNVIEDTVLPAYRELDRYFNDRYLPATRDSIGLSSLPDGDTWYEFRARLFTTTRLSPDEIHRIGLDEVKRIRDEMMQIKDEVGFDGAFEEFLDHLRTDPQFYFDNADDLYREYLATSKRIDPELVKLFGTLPRMPYGVKPIPDAIAPDTTTAYYSRPAADGSRAGIYYVNLYKPEVRPKYEIEVLTVHEAMPGHHLQLALQQELGDVPNFRRFMGFTAFVEGWALYSERLGYDLGLYKDPYSRFGQLTYDMWRAVRLVVDTGMHYKGWTRQQAIDFFKDNAAKTEHDIVNEIDRYILWPGQALAYKIGQLKVLQLRSRAEVELGDRFDIRAFHDELLGAGALPLDLLELRMDRWMAAQ
jgi:prolyl oligopeptidase